MKKILILLSFAITIFCNNNILAQDGCSAPCEWEDIDSAVVTDPCTYTVYFQWCKDGGDFYFKIVGFGLISYDCYGYTMYELIYGAMLQILDEDWLTNDAAYPDEENECIDDISGYTASCWKWSGILGPSNPVNLLPCDESSCCEYLWQLCYQGGQIQKYLTGVNNGEPCDNPPPEGCFVVCPEL